MIKCGICGKEFNDNQLDEYAAHVSKCAYNKKIKEDTERMKKINDELVALKNLKADYEKASNEFKAKYPDVYNANFGKEKITGSDPKPLKKSDFNKYDKSDSTKNAESGNKTRTSESRTSGSNKELNEFYKEMAEELSNILLGNFYKFY